MSKRILVTGATGNIGSQVIPKLLAAGATVHALVRDLEKAKPLADAGAKLFKGDFEDEAAIKAALEGVEALLSITPPGPTAVEQSSVMIQAAAKASNKPSILRISAIGAAPDAPTENGRLHFKTDEEIKATGNPFTILRPHFFMQNIWASVPTIADHGSMYMGMGEGKMGMVDVRDIVDASVEILMNDKYDGGIHTLTGPKSISLNEVAESISDSIGKPVKYIPVSLDEVRKAIIDMGWGEWGAELMVDYSKAYGEGWGDFTNDHFTKITGNKPRNIQNFTNEVFVHAFQEA